jgi:general stress protein 26
MEDLKFYCAKAVTMYSDTITFFSQSALSSLKAKQIRLRAKISLEINGYHPHYFVWVCLI